jgi:hypothetical protein
MPSTYCKFSEEKKYMTAYIVTPNFLLLEGEKMNYEMD